MLVLVIQRVLGRHLSFRPRPDWRRGITRATSSGHDLGEESYRHPGRPSDSAESVDLRRLASAPGGGRWSRRPPRRPRPGSGAGWGGVRRAVAFLPQVALHRRQRAAEPPGQRLQTLVGVGMAEADDLVVVHLAAAAGDAGQGVEVLRLDRDAAAGDGSPCAAWPSCRRRTPPRRSRRRRGRGRRPDRAGRTDLFGLPRHRLGAVTGGGGCAQPGRLLQQRVQEQSRRTPRRGSGPGGGADRAGRAGELDGHLVSKGRRGFRPS